VDGAVLVHVGEQLEGVVLHGVDDDVSFAPLVGAALVDGPAVSEGVPGSAPSGAFGRLGQLRLHCSDLSPLIGWRSPILSQGADSSGVFAGIDGEGAGSAH
jgi:hypothetical protein